MQASESFANYDEQTQPAPCRICLQPCKAELEPYCQCKGNSKYVHELCLLEWAKRVDKSTTKSHEVYFLCDLCQSPIYLSIEKTCICRPLKEIRSLGGVSKVQFCLLLSVGLIFGIVTGLCLKYLVASDELQMILLILSIVFGVVSLSSLSILIYKIFCSIGKEVVGLKKYAKRQSKNRVVNTYTMQNL